MRSWHFVHRFQHFDALDEPCLAFDGASLLFAQESDVAAHLTDLAVGAAGGDDGTDGQCKDQHADDEQSEDDEFFHNAVECLSIGGQWKLIFPGGIIDKPYRLSPSV